MNPSRKVIVVILSLFLIGIAPFALNHFLVAPSEPFYTDASITMMKNGDYFTPYFDGDFRFKKPILTYWMVLPAFKLLGVSFWSSRVLFWLSGALTLLITWRISRLFFEENIKAATLAVLITATHPLLVISSSRSIPDMPLSMFIALGIWGILGILKYNCQQKKYLFYMYAGFGLAFAVKGVPALILIGLALSYMWINRLQRIPVLKTLYLPALITGLGLGLWWFVLMFQWYGQDFISGFLFDQVDDRVIKESWRLYTNTLAFLLLVFYPIPWNLMILLRIKKFKQWFGKADPLIRSSVWITLIWALFFFGTAPIFNKIL